jgi:HD-GYP domain-containing protein (c-di-GMP phosphodiesterase class II)
MQGNVAAHTTQNIQRAPSPAGGMMAANTIADLRVLLGLARHEGDVDQVYRAIVERCAKDSGFSTVELLRADDVETWTLCARTGSGGAPGGVGAAQVLEPGNVVRQAYESGEPRWAGECLVVPLMVGIGSWGAIVLTRGDRAIDEHSLARIGVVAEAGALVIGYYEARARLAVAGNTDALTGLPHRRLLLHEFEREMARSRRNGYSLSLAVLEVVFHPTGEAEEAAVTPTPVLVQVAQVLDGLVRRDEMIAHLDNDSFGWILVGVDHSGSAMAAARAMEAVSSAAFDGGDVMLTVGVADMRHGQSAGAVLRRAQEALTWANKEGIGSIAHYSPGGRDEAGVGPVKRALGTMKPRGPVAAMMRTLDAVDSVASRHSERVGELAARIAYELGWSETLIGAVRDAGCLHDIGMLCIPETILGKPGPLTDEEFEIVKRHTLLGAELASKIVMPAQASWIRGHHERWDGTGYPDGLEGSEIPEGASILAAADAWDTMTTARHYAAVRSRDEAVAEMHAGSGTQFAPHVVEALGRAIGEQEPTRAPDATEPVA